MDDVELHNLPVDRVLERAREHLEKGELREAADFYQHVRERRPERWEGHLGLGHSLYSAGQVAAALEVVPDAIRVEPTCMPAYQLLAYIGIHGGMPDRVIEWLEFGAQGMGDQAVIFEWLTRLYAMDGRDKDLRNCLAYYARIRQMDLREVARIFSRDATLPDDIRRRIIGACGY